MKLKIHTGEQKTIFQHYLFLYAILIPKVYYSVALPLGIQNPLQLGIVLSNERVRIFSRLNNDSKVYYAGCVQAK